MIMAGTLVLLASVYLFDTSWYAFLLLLPAALITFVLSLIIGHFLAEPLNVLVQKVEAYRAGADVMPRRRRHSSYPSMPGSMMSSTNRS